MMDAVGYTRQGDLGLVTLDDGKVNAMSLPWFAALGAALDRAEADRPGALMLTGRPGMFSAGLNLKVMPGLTPEEFQRTLAAFGHTMLRVFTFPFPTVAAIGGHAIAGGAILAFACDLRVMAGGPFRLHLNETAIGLALPTWAITIAAAAIPHRWHTEAILHARPYSPAEALARELIDAVATPPETLLDRARDLAAPLAALNTAAYAESKRRQRAMAVRWAEDVLPREQMARPRPAGS